MFLRGEISFVYFFCWIIGIRIPIYEGTVQCCGSGSGLYRDSFGSVGPPPVQRQGKPKWPTTRTKKKGQSYVIIKELYVLFSGDLFWSLDVLRGSWRRNILIFCINVICFFTSYSEKFGHVNRIWFRSVLWNSGSLDPDSQSGPGSRRAKMTQKNRKKLINFIFWSAGWSLLGL
jgi:hypothetical protein